MHVRPATTDDQDAILEVHERAVYELAGEHYREAVLDAWTDVGDSEGADSDGDGTDRDDADGDGTDGDGTDDEGDGAQPENGRRFVADVEGAVAGFGDVRFAPPEYLTEPADGGVRAVYVHPEHAGNGVGTALLERLESVARDRGLESLGLLASVNARGFYERHGYEVVTDRTFTFGEDARGQDVEGPAVEMRKDL